ncbi:MAG: hypothetical protein AAF808_10875, partial [Cyanobacteria bacterium P01_D01_bin.2]
VFRRSSLSLIAEKIYVERPGNVLSSIFQVKASDCLMLSESFLNPGIVFLAIRLKLLRLNT